MGRTAVPESTKTMSFVVRIRARLQADRKDIFIDAP